MSHRKNGILWRREVIVPVSFRKKGAGHSMGTDMWGWLVRLIALIGGGASVLVVLSGAAAFVFREKLKQMFSRSLEKDLEEHRATLAIDHARFSDGLNREMEAYRVSLVAESERLKAEQHLKTSLALKLGERRYDAICKVYDSYAGLNSAVQALARHAGEAQLLAGFYRQSWTEKFERVTMASDAFMTVQIYLPHDLQLATLDLQKCILRVLSLRPTIAEDVVPGEHPDAEALMVAARVFDSIVGRELDALGLPTSYS